MNTQLKIRYDENKQLQERFSDQLKSLILRCKARRVCDIGGGRNPQLLPDFITGNEIDYTLCDISKTELELAPKNYHKVVADIGSNELSIQNKYDFIFSRMVAEHIKDGKQFHQNVYNMLRPGGYAFHFFPTFFCLPFVANRLMPERLADRMLNIFSPRDRQVQEKFPAFYSWCRGPIKTHTDRLEKLGYKIEEFQGFYGHGYFHRVPIVRSLHSLWTRRLLRKPNPWFTSFAFLLLQKPQAAH